MKLKRYCTALLLVLCFITRNCFAQINEDSSETWTVKQNKGLFGLAKPSFGSYSTVDISKIDSTGFTRRKKESSYATADISREGTDLDFLIMMTIEKTKFYKIQLGNAIDTIEARFGIASISHEERQTFLDKLVSKNDEGKNKELDKNRNLAGEIILNNNNQRWSFYIKDLFNFQTQVPFTFLPVAVLSGGLLKNGNDSLDIQNSSPGIVDVHRNNEILATLSFQKKRPEMQIHNDIDKPLQEAIATVFAVIIAVKDYQ